MVAALAAFVSRRNSSSVSTWFSTLLLLLLADTEPRCRRVEGGAGEEVSSLAVKAGITAVEEVPFDVDEDDDEDDDDDA